MEKLNACSALLMKCRILKSKWLNDILFYEREVKVGLLLDINDMALIFEEESRKNALMMVAERMLLAARTAPKGRGVDNIVAAIAGKDEIKLLADKMRELVDKKIAAEFFLRDAENILSTEVAVLIGTRIKPMGLVYCGLCGHGNCAGKEKFPDTPCIFNTGDLGIAIGSAVSTAADCRVDNRIMYSAGIAARDMNMLGDDVKIIYAIPISSTSKNPFFDRVWPKR